MKWRSHLALALAGTLMLAGRSVHAQQLTATWQPTDQSNWNVDANWMLTNGSSLVPDVAFGDHALIDNGGTAIVDSAVTSVANLTVNNGTLDIRNGGELNSIVPEFDPVGGVLQIGAAGNVRIAGNGQLTAEVSATNAGTVSLTGNAATLDIAGDFTNNGTIEAVINADTHSAIQVTGNARLGGTLAATFDGITPAFGDSWDIITAGSFTGDFSTLDTSDLGSLPTGLQLRTEMNGNAVQLAVGNTLVVEVDRLSGETIVSNVVGGPIEIVGYGILSNNGLLNAAGTNSLESQGMAGWRSTGSNSNNHLAELNLENSTTLGVGESFNLGNAYSPGPQKPGDEDVRFEFLTLDGNILDGVVQYNGPVSDLVLTVDPVTGNASISNLSPLITPPDVTSYTVTSEAGSLNPAFASFADNPAQAGAGWRSVNPSAEHVGELNLESSKAFANGTVALLNDLFNVGGAQDLLFQYSTVAGDVLVGSVVYGAIPDAPMGLPADFNGDGMVDLSDFNILKGNFGTMGATMDQGDANLDGNVDLSDFNILKASFGQSGAAAVPEPSTVLLAICGLAGLLYVGWKRRK